MKYVFCLILSLLATPAMAQVVYQQPVVVQQKVVEFDSRYFLGDRGYYSTVENIKSERLTETVEGLKAEVQRLVGLLQAKDAQIDVLLKLLKGTGKDTPKVDIPTTPTAEAPVPADKPAEAPVEPDNGEYQSTELDEKVFAIFKAKCAQCHSETNANKLVLYKKSNDALIDQPLEYRALIHKLVQGVDLDSGERSMPPGKPLEDTEVSILYKWMQEEASRLIKKGK